MVRYKKKKKKTHFNLLYEHDSKVYDRIALERAEPFPSTVPTVADVGAVVRGLPCGKFKS